MKELEFSIPHRLRYERAVDCVYELMDSLEDTESFDEMEWDEDEDTAYLWNDDLEVEVFIGEDEIEVYAQLHARDLDPDQIREDLTLDICEYFGLDLPPSVRRRDRPARKAPREAPRRDRSRHKDSEEEAPRRRRPREESNEEVSSRPARKGKSKWAAEGSDRDELPRSSRAIAQETKSKEENKPVPAPPAPPAPAKSGGMSWFWWVVILAAIGSAVFFFLGPLLSK